MKIRYFSEDGCSGSANEVVYVPDGDIGNFPSKEALMQSLICAYGCNQCVEYGEVPEETPHHAAYGWDAQWEQLMPA